MSITPQLQRRIVEFLPTLRVGIDFGEWTGGIAVLRGNQLLHASTYLDFHAADLSERRRMRRGRRTRHAKKMRLARLRSWILRQRLSDGTQLPDPYRVMHIRGLWVQPGVYRQPGADPDSAPSWVERAKEEGVTPDVFVRALTLLFQRRGYAWEGSDLGEMSDKELAQELKRVRLTPDVRAQIEAEIQRRSAHPEPEKEGKVANLERLLDEALARARQPRVAEHRSVVKGDLREVVAAFAARYNPSHGERWADQLARLLDKPVRFARFENRMVSGCSWCGKSTPRKSRPGIRDDAYFAAGANLRIEELNAKRPLSEAEKDYFVQLWQERNSGQRIALRALAGKLAEMRCQPEMASQLWDLLYSEAPRGRTNLCVQHLKLQREGAFLCNRHRAICQLLGADQHEILEQIERHGPAERVTRNPCREAFDRRVVNRLERILFRGPGHPRFAALPTLITIEFPKPHTARTYACPGCAEKLAVDLRLRYKIKNIQLSASAPRDALYRFACPACGVDLTIRAKRPVTIRGQRQFVPVTLKNTDAFLRRAKGGLKEKKRRMFLSETRGACVYCESSLDLNMMEIDHIFPESAGGPSVDTNLVAVCRSCNRPDTGKGSRTPWQWRGERDGPWWAQFEARVGRLPIPVRKQSVLLSKEEQFPENPTALARAGARPRQFVEDLKDMLVRNGASRERIADNYEHGKLVIQTIDGWMTSRLRRSWLQKADGAQNFPEKDNRDLRNHAQDAALIAACPPHTWREQIFVAGEYRDLAPPQLAPDWAAFEAANQKPIVELLGNYSVRWRRSLAAETLWAEPELIDTPRVKCHKPIEEIWVSQAEGIVSPVLRERFVQLAQELAIEGKKPLPADKLRERFPGARRLRLWATKMGVPVKVRRRQDRVVRKIQLRAEAASEGALFWRKPGGRKTLEISILRPAFCERYGLPRVDPPTGEGAEQLGKLRRHESIWLDADYAEGHPAGWYRIKEFSRSGIIALHESSFPKEIAQRVGAAAETPVERKLGKTELLEFFEKRKARS